jgi:hypothetical protein
MGSEVNNIRYIDIYDLSDICTVTGINQVNLFI